MESMMNMKVFLLIFATSFVSSVWGMEVPEVSKKNSKKRASRRPRVNKTASQVIPPLEIPSHDDQASLVQSLDRMTPSVRAVKAYNNSQGWNSDSFRAVSSSAPLSATSELHRRIKNQQWDGLESVMRPLQLDRSLDDETGNTALHILCLQNKVKLINELIKSSDDVARVVNAPNNQGNTALHLAAGTEHTKSIEVLLNCRFVDVNAANDDGDTPLHIACRMNRLESVKTLVAHEKTHVNAQNISGNTPIHLASLYYFNREYQDHDQDEYTSDVLECLVFCLRVQMHILNNNGHIWEEYSNNADDIKVKKIRQAMRGRRLLTENSAKVGVWSFKKNLIQKNS